MGILRYRTNVKMVQRLTYRRRLSYNTPVTNGALSVLQVVNSPTSTRRSQGRSPNVVCARPHCEVSDLLAPMKGSACLLDRRKYTALMEVACATTACRKRS